MKYINVPIEIDGIVLELGAPFGNTNAAKDHNKYTTPNLNSKEFKKWFGNSKVIDKEGKPLVVYHQTKEKFSSFKVGGKDSSISGPAIWFADPSMREKLQSAHNVSPKDIGARVIPVYLHIKNPLIIDKVTRDWAQTVFAEGSKNFPLLIKQSQIDSIRSEGYDGIIYHDVDTNQPKEYIVFEPTQVKSALSNSGNYDSKISDIQLNIEGV